MPKNALWANKTYRLMAGENPKQKVKPIIEKCTISYVCYSPLKRAAETMMLATQELTCPKEPINSLKEWHLGALEGLSKGGLSLQELTPLGGESWQQFAGRVVTGVNQALMHPDPVLIVAHSGVYAVLCYHMKIENSVISNCQLLYFNPIMAGDYTYWTLEIKC